MSGSKNVVAVFFSRLSVNTIEQSQNVSGVYIDVFDLPELAKRQTEGFRSQMTIEYLNGVQEVTIGNEKLLCDKSVVPRPILPPDCRFLIFSQLHDLFYPDWKVTKKMILSRLNGQKLVKKSNCGAKNVFSVNGTKFQDTQNIKHARLMTALPDSVIYN